MTEQLDGYMKRLVPVSDKEVIALAESMWANPKLRQIFERVGYDGDFTEDEEATATAAIYTYRQGPLWGRDKLHFRLAPCLLRQLAEAESLIGERWVPIMPCMSVTAEIKTGQRRLIEYFISPFLEYQDEAARER